MTEEENAADAAAVEEVEELRLTGLECRMEATAANMERRMEATAEVAKISERGMKEAAEEAEVKADATKAAAEAADSVSSTVTLSVATAASTAASAFAGCTMLDGIACKLICSTSDVIMIT